ncbi:MAG: hypothetical protein HY275_15845 [Gemmatimonadetes bacterium]|nr:hypothetical protein [Gemmatimonadota bacterium]
MRTVGTATCAETEREALVRLHTLGDVLAWARALTPPRAPEAIITQDEYTHDVVLALGPARWLAFDTT